MAANYKRVWRALRLFSLEDSFNHVWRYSRLISGGVPLPLNYNHTDVNGTQRRIEKFVHPHEIDLIARELVLHADNSGRKPTETLATWRGITLAFNEIKTYANGITDTKSRDALMLTIHRIGHQQMPRFSRFSAAKVGRYLALYRSPDLADVFYERLGITVDAYFVLAFAVLGSSLSSPRMNTKTDFSVLGIQLTQSENFFARVVAHVDVIRDKLNEVKRLNTCWEYTLNAIHSRPLVALDKDHPERVYCPLPTALEARLFEGLFFDVFHTGKRFENAYGEAFDGVCGRILRSLVPLCEVEKPEPFKIGREQYLGVDWIVDQGGDIAYFECKTKRMALKGRVAENISDMRSEVQVLADAVVQNYANIVRHREVSARPPSSSVSYCVVVTLEDWVLFSEPAFSALDEFVANGLAKEGLPASLKSEVPYVVLSVEALQYCAATLRHHSMRDVFGTAGDDTYDGWAFGTYLKHRFPDEDAEGVGAFDAEFKKLFEPYVEQHRAGTATTYRAPSLGDPTLYR